MRRMRAKLRVSKGSLVIYCVSFGMVPLLASCGGGSSGPPPQQDFSVSVSPSATSMTVGTISPPAVITVVGQNGFTGQVSIEISGLPPGATSSPATPFKVSTSGSQQVVLFIPPATQTGTLSLQFEATSGIQFHSAPLTLTVMPVSGTVGLQEVPGQESASTIEIQGLSAGSFNSSYWQQNTLNWVPDVREPMFTALSTSPYQNIYAPWVLEQPSGWRMFYGGWDGSNTPNDRVYSATTSDFLSFNNRMLVIDQGAFQHVNNVNVHQLPDGSLHMICTGGEYDQTNWPTYFSSPDGVNWNGSRAPYQAQLGDVVDIQGYSGYSGGGFNAGNVLFRDSNTWTLYFYDNNNNGQIYRATGTTPHTVQLQGIALKTGADPNGVMKFMVGTQPWYLMGLMSNAPQLWYSLSNDAITFAPMQTLFYRLSPVDNSMDSVGFVTKRNQLLGALYGANTGSPDNQLSDNQIYARWLQKKVVITDFSGAQYSAQGSYGPDRQWFQGSSSGNLEGTMVVYAEDGITPLGSSLVTLTAGKSYSLVLQ
jgi:hypothetical protein